ncbi:hypothetical protein ACMA5I_13455 [Paracoccaceae bacterium GXU_MW_L88]
MSEDSEESDEIQNPDTAPEWLIGFRRSAHQKGFYISGEGYGVVFTDRGEDVLMVSCDNLSSARDDTMDRSPWGYAFVAKNGWSQLGIMTYNADWFRNDDLLTYLASLRDSGFFHRFKKIVMTGTSMGGYAACAFASLAPGCTVIAFSPQSTLDERLVPWEERFNSGRKANWDGLFRDGAVEAKAAKEVFLIYDSEFPPDVRHVERFDSANVTRLPARYSGHKTALFLRRAGLLSSVVKAAVAGELTKKTFDQIYRGGREMPWYINAVQRKLVDTGRHRHLPRFAAAARSMGREAIARSAEAKAVKAGVLAPPTEPDEKSAQKAQGKQSGAPNTRFGPHEQRLAARAAKEAAAKSEPAEGEAPKAAQQPRAVQQPKAAPEPAPVQDLESVDLYHEDPSLPPLEKVGTLPWQQAQSMRKSNKWTRGT